MTSFYPRQKVFECAGKRSANLIDVLPRRVTLRRDVEPWAHLIVHRRDRTPFAGVRVAKGRTVWGEACLDLADHPPRRIEVDDARFFDEVWPVFLGIVERAWDPAKFHFVLHSSGLDSRLISAAIRALARKNGPDWLGDVLFVECDGEAGTFKALMEATGWKPHQYAVYRQAYIDPAGRLYPGYHLYSLEFAHAWRRLNGYAAFPINCWWEPVQWFQESGRIPGDADLQCWTGHAANTITRFWHEPYGIRHLFRFHWHTAYAQYGLKGTWVHPFLHLDYIRAVYQHGLGRRDYRAMILDRVLPEAASIPPDTWQQRQARGHRDAHEVLLKHALADYRQSWYGREVRPDLQPDPPEWMGRPRQLSYTEWWCAWALASLCEHLREHGYIIDVQN